MRRPALAVVRDGRRFAPAALIAALLCHAAVIAGLTAIPPRKAPNPPAEPEAMLLTLLAPGTVAEVAAVPPDPPEPMAEVPQPPAPPDAVAAAPQPLVERDAVPTPPAALAELPLPPPPAASVPAPPSAAAPPDAVARSPSVGRTSSPEPMADAGGPTLGARLQDEACPDRTIVYPAAAEERGIGGRVRLFLRISDQGEVVEAAIAESSGFTVLDDAARAGIGACRFLAALHEGRPVWSTASMPVTFQNPGGGRK